MIRESDLHEAIAECVGKRNPDSSTCIKLAAYYTILNELYPSKEQSVKEPGVPVLPVQSFSVQPENIEYEGDSEFARLMRGRSVSHIMPILDELMETLEAIQPRMYAGVMRRIRESE